MASTPPSVSCSCTSCYPIELCAGPIAQLGTEQHTSRISVWETANHTGRRYRSIRAVSKEILCTRTEKLRISFSASCISSFVDSSTLPRTTSFPLIISSFNCKPFRYGLLSSPEQSVAASSYQSAATPASFYLLFQVAKLILPYPFFSPCLFFWGAILPGYIQNLLCSVCSTPHRRFTQSFG